MKSLKALLEANDPMEAMLGQNPQSEPSDLSKYSATPNHNKLSVEDKKQLLLSVSKFNEYKNALSMADEMKQVAERIVYIAEMTEKYSMNENNDWFNDATLTRDMKELKKNASELHKVSNKMYPQMKLAKHLYEEIGLKLQKYYDI